MSTPVQDPARNRLRGLRLLYMAAQTDGGRQWCKIRMEAMHGSLLNLVPLSDASFVDGNTSDVISSMRSAANGAWENW